MDSVLEDSGKVTGKGGAVCASPVEGLRLEISAVLEMENSPSRQLRRTRTGCSRPQQGFLPVQAG